MNNLNNQKFLKYLKVAETAYLEFSLALDKFNTAVDKARIEIQKARDIKKLASIRKIIK